MKYLPVTTILLWMSIIVAYLYAREFILQPIFKFPAVILLATFLPICFWVLASQNKRVYSSVFLLIFLFNTGILTYGALRNYSFLNSLDPYKGARIDPQLAKLLVTGESKESRNVAARLLYEKHGISLPFMTSNNHFVLYSPTKGNKSIFLRNNAENLRLSYLKHNTIYEIDSFLFLLAIQVTLFIGLLCFLILHEKPTYKPMHDKTCLDHETALSKRGRQGEL